MKNEVLIFGHSPSPNKKANKKTATMKRLDKWFGMFGLGYKIVNLNDEPSKKLDYDQIDDNQLYEAAAQYKRVYSIGGEVTKYLDMLNIAHHPLPHPSPVNRNWNQQMSDATVIWGLHKDLDVV